MKLRLFFIFLLVILAVPAVFSAETSAIVGEPLPQRMMPVEPTQPEFLGQDQFYTVTFRGNGEAVVTMKAIFSNLENPTKSTLVYKIPRGQTKDIAAYQVIRERQCVQYEPSTDGKTSPLCAQYQEPDYYGYYYGSSSYLKAQTAINGDTVTVTLPNPVAGNKSGAIILYYRANGYTAKNFAGAYHFVFESPSTDEPVRTMQIGISTDSDLVLKGSQGVVNYAAPEATSKMMAVDRVGGGASGAQFDSFYQQIGQGTIVKSASNLQAHESYTVDGMYAATQVQLYAKEIVTTILVLILIIALVAFIISRIAKKMKTAPAGNKNSVNVMLAIGVGFATAVVLSLHTALVYFITTAVQNSYYSQFSLLLALGITIVAASIYLLVFIVPAIVVGVKRGLWAGVMTAISTVIWLGIGLVILIGFFLIFNRQLSPAPVLMMKSSGAAEGSAPMDLQK